MIKLWSLYNAYQGRPVVVLGGGPSLLADLALAPAECLRIGVNDHFYHAGLQAEFMVFMDDLSLKPGLREAAENFGGTRVSETLACTDVDLRGIVRPDARSGIFAAWFAMYLGFAPILLAGMDLYQGDKKYIHDQDDWMGHKAIFDEPLEKLLNDWRVLKKYPNYKNIRALSGPLVRVFKAYA